MKENAKVRKAAGERKEFKIGKRMWNSEEMMIDDGNRAQVSLKVKRGEDGRGIPVPNIASQGTLAHLKKWSLSVLYKLKRLFIYTLQTIQNTSIYLLIVDNTDCFYN